MSERDLRDAIKSLVVESVHLEGVDPASIVDDEALFGGRLGLDSVDALEIMVALEKRFGLTLQGKDVDAKAFASISSLAQLVQGRLEDPAGGRLEGGPAPPAGS